MHTLKLLATLLKVNIQQELAYRADALLNGLLSLMWLGWELLSLSIIFSNTATLGGWGPGELITLLGVWRLVNTMMAALVWPNTQKFNTSVRDGSLDYLLLQPASSLFLVSFSRIVIWRAWDIVLAAILMVVGLNMRSTEAAPLNLATFLALTISGTLIIYSLWIVLIACRILFFVSTQVESALSVTSGYPPTSPRYL